MTRPYSVLPLPNRLSLLVAWLALPGVSVASLAAAWGTHPQTIYSLMAKGQVPRSRAGLTERLPFMYVLWSGWFRKSVGRDATISEWVEAVKVAVPDALTRLSLPDDRLVIPTAPADFGAAAGDDDLQADLIDVVEYFEGFCDKANRVIGSRTRPSH